MAAGMLADIVIVAAGESRRMGGVDKLEAPLLGRPLLSWTIEQMRRAGVLRRLIVVVAPARVDHYRAAAWLARHDVHVVAGGEHRSASVLAGVSVADAPVVLVHDGARPLASGALADRVAQAAAEHGAAVPAVTIVDSVKRAAAGRLTESIAREGLVRAQTPQGARRDLLLDAIAASGNASFGDEAGLLHSRDIPVALVEGEESNLKVTGPADLVLAEALLTARVGNQQRSGTGYDSHPFGPADGLRIGGIVIDEAPRLYGHSDGDVVLHAIASALLAAAGQGDLGRHFPAGEPATAGVASTVLLASVLELVGTDGWRPRSVQVALVGARPRFGAPRLEQMRQRLADLLGLSPAAVALSASSGNLTGAEGAGRALSASAGVTLGRS